MYDNLGKGFDKQNSKVQVFFVKMNPVAKGRPRFTRKLGRTYTPKKTKDATQQIADVLSAERQDTIEKHLPVAVYLRFMCKRPKALKKGDRILKTTKPDIDNYIKLVLDACNDAKVWHDDSQVVEILAQKWYCADYQEPEIQIQISRL